MKTVVLVFTFAFLGYSGELSTNVKYITSKWPSSNFYYQKESASFYLIGINNAWEGELFFASIGGYGGYGNHSFTMSSDFDFGVYWKFKEVNPYVAVGGLFIGTLGAEDETNETFGGSQRKAGYLLPKIGFGVTLFSLIRLAIEVSSNDTYSFATGYVF